MKRSRAMASAVVMAAFLLLAAACVAAIPQKMNYQVMLTDDADQPLSNQSVELVFRIYDADVGGTLLWSETHFATTNAIGVVSVILGSAMPLAIDFSGPLWLDVSVDGETLAPRRELVSAPYVLHDEVGGAGDGYSLDADDGSPVDALYVDSEGRVGVGTTTPEALMHVQGALQLGSAQPSGGLYVEAGGGAVGEAVILGAGSLGVSYKLYAGGAAPIASLAPAHTGSGGLLEIAKNNAGVGGISLIGNTTGAQDPTLAMYGDGRDLTLYMGAADGDASVSLPDEAVNAQEILDEPGLASAADAGVYNLTGSVQSVSIRSLSAPADGYIFALGTVELRIQHVNGTESQVYIGLTDDYPSYSSTQLEQVRISSAAPSGYYNQVVTVQGVFSATGGLTKTVRIFCWRIQGSGGSTSDEHLTLLYFPTAYGTVQTIDARGASEETPADLR